MNIQKTIAVGSLCGIAAFVLAVPLAGEFGTFMRDEVKRAEKAFSSKDISYFEKTSTGDFTYKDIDGKVQSKKEALAGMKQFFAMAKTLKSTITLKKAVQSGNKGVAELAATYDITMGPMGPDDKTKSHKMHVQQASRETWVKSGNTWKLSLIAETSKAKMTLDGKPFDPTKAGG